MNIDPSKIILTLEDRLKQIVRIRKFINKWDKSLYRIFNRFLPINQKYIIFQSFHGKSYSCNPRAIYEQMLITKLEKYSRHMKVNLDQYQNQASLKV
ncbi:CDP-glycerol glycerophosphotransferase family protein, partial [Bacillus sp. D-CC]